MIKPGYIIFTDLDGTLLDVDKYSAAGAEEALKKIKESDIPLIFVTSKTAMEIIGYREKLDNRHPFICENGGGIYIPKSYFDGKPVPDKFDIIGLGLDYASLRRELKKAASELGIGVLGMADMTDDEIIKYTNISRDDVPLARQRRFDEPFVIKSSDDPQGDIQRLEFYFREKGLNVVRGNRFYHLNGNCDKGAAIKELIERYRKAFGPGWISIGLGDSPNDIPMFEVVDIPAAVMKPPAPGSHDSEIRDFPGLNLARGIGPEGWNDIVLQLLEKEIASG